MRAKVDRRDFAEDGVVEIGVRRLDEDRVPARDELGDRGRRAVLTDEEGEGAGIKILGVRILEDKGVER